jgi:remodeling and spacing factor 1
MTNNDEVPKELQDIHVKLLRKLKKSVVFEKYERALVKFCYNIGEAYDAVEVERYGYKNSALAVKLRIMKNLVIYYFNII